MRLHAVSRGVFAGAVLSIALSGGAGAVELGIRGSQFTLDGEEAFLLGISYYGGLGAPCDTVRQDFDVDVTFSRGNGVVAAEDGLKDVEAHSKAAAAVALALRGRGNVYIDMGNERNIKDPRHVPFEELATIREAIREADPERLATASQAGDIPTEDLERYVTEAGVDFISPHRPRNARSPGQTEARTESYLAELAKLGRTMPVHYQEPFRRDFSPWQPKAADFIVDLRGAVSGGAAGWCLHNGSPRRNYEGPSRSFDLRPGQPRLMEQLDADEQQVLDAMDGAVAAAKPLE